MHLLDAKVEYLHLSTFDPALAAVSTPDWMMYLVAQAAGFDGVVTRDRSQLDEPEHLVALLQSRLSVVTWRKGIDDPVTEWGQLMAFMPQVLKAIDAHGPSIFLLPVPRLDKATHIENPREAAYQLAIRRSQSFPEMRDEALALMEQELRRRNRLDLLEPAT